MKKLTKTYFKRLFTITNKKTTNLFEKNNFFLKKKKNFSDKPQEKHFKIINKDHPFEKKKNDDNYIFPHFVYTQDELKDCEKTHFNPKTMTDTLALNAIRTIRYFFDLFSGFTHGKLTSDKFLRRMIYLETVAGIPGMVAGSLRHLKSLRRMKRDYGWIHHLLEEAENERMHMLTFLHMKQPTLLFKFMVLMAQGVFWNGFFFCLSHFSEILS